MINRQKYVDLAYQTPRGRLAMSLVEAHWDEWVRAASTMVKAKKALDAQQVAKDIFWEAVWGFGLEDWTPQEAKRVDKKSGRRSSTKFHAGYEGYPRSYSALDIWLEKIFSREAVYIFDEFS